MGIFLKYIKMNKLFLIAMIIAYIYSADACVSKDGTAKNTSGADCECKSGNTDCKDGEICDSAGACHAVCTANTAAASGKKCGCATADNAAVFTLCDADNACMANTCQKLCTSADTAISGSACWCSDAFSSGASCAIGARCKTKVCTPACNQDGTKKNAAACVCTYTGPVDCTANQFCDSAKCWDACTDKEVAADTKCGCETSTSGTFALCAAEKTCASNTCNDRPASCAKTDGTTVNSAACNCKDAVNCAKDESCDGTACWPVCGDAEVAADKKCACLSATADVYALCKATETCKEKACAAKDASASGAIFGIIMMFLAYL